MTKHDHEAMNGLSIAIADADEEKPDGSAKDFGNDPNYSVAPEHQS